MSATRYLCGNDTAILEKKQPDEMDSHLRDYVVITIFVIPSGTRDLQVMRRINSSEARRRASPMLYTGESSISIKFWMPAFAGMTVLMAISNGAASISDYHWIPACAGMTMGIYFIDEAMIRK